MRLTVYVPQLGPVLALLRKIDERMGHMATKEELQAVADQLGGSLDTLGTAYTGLSGDVQTLGDRITDLEAQVAAGNDIDLGPIREVADQLQARTQDFAALDGLNTPAPTEPTPEPDPEV